MKKHKSLIPLSIALPGLLTVSVSGYVGESVYKYPTPPFNAAADSGPETGYTEAIFQNYLAKNVRKVCQGINAYTQDVETMYNVPVDNVTYLAATYSWNVGCYTEGYVAVWDRDDPDSPENTPNYTKYGYAYVY